MTKGADKESGGIDWSQYQGGDFFDEMITLAVLVSALLNTWGSSAERNLKAVESRRRALFAIWGSVSPFIQMVKISIVRGHLILFRG